MARRGGPSDAATDLRPFARRLAAWRLVADGAPLATHSSKLLPVRRDGKPAMLKLSTAPEEIAGAAVLAWWRGQGAAEVLELEDDALLIVRAEGGRSLADLAHEGRDDEASRILCAVADQLHAPRAAPSPPLDPLAERFEPRLALVASEARLERGWLLQWIIAWAGLSAVWSLDAGETPAAARETLAIALAVQAH